MCLGFLNINISMVFDQQRERGRTRLIGRPGRAMTEVPCALGPLLFSILLSSARPGNDFSVLSALCSVRCFIMPTVMLFTLSSVSCGSSVGFVVGGVARLLSPSNFLMSLSFRVVSVPVLRFLRRYDGVVNP